MGIIKKLRGRSPYDRFLGDQETRSAYDSLAKGSWQESEALLDRRADGWLIEGMLAGERSEVPIAVFDAWAEQDPSSTPLSMLGLGRIRDAWQLRGDATSKEVPEEAWPAYSGALADAEQALSDARSADPDAASPWAALLRSGRGLEESKTELRRRFDESHAREPFRQDACVQFLQCVTAKWGGSDRAMFDFARWVERDAPPDSPAHLTLPMAHFEAAIMAQWNDVANFGDYLQKSKVVDELTAAAESFLEATPAEAPVDHLGVLNAFVSVIAPVNAGAGVVLRECVERIDKRPTEFPWANWGDDPLTRYERTAQAQLEEAAQYGLE